MTPHPPALARVLERAGRPTEAQVQQRVKATYEAVGCTWWNLSQGYRPGGGRHGTTRQAKGLPDGIVTHPARGLFWVHETKRPGGKQRPEQRTFQVHCEAAGIAYVLGGVEAALTHLQRLGLIANDAIRVRS